MAGQEANKMIQAALVALCCPEMRRLCPVLTGQAGPLPLTSSHW